MSSRLAIDYGAVSTRAVLAWPDGSWTVLTFDGSPALSSAVHVSRAAISVGAQAWRQGAADPDGLVLSPKRAETGEMTVNGRRVEAAELVAATLRAVADQAARIDEHHADEVCLIIPACWGPRRRSWLRHAAHKAGLPVTRLMEAPVAAAAHLTAGSAAGKAVLVIDVGAGCEVTVLLRGPSGYEVLATLADPDAGGDRIDADLATALTGTDLPGLSAVQRWRVLSDVRAAKQALTEQIAVTMPMPGSAPPVVINGAQVAQAVRPVFERVAELAAAVVGNADLEVGELAAVYLVGAAAVTPEAIQIIEARLGTAVHLAPQPELVTVTAAVGAGHPETGSREAADRLALPPWQRLVALGLPGLYSLVLFAQFMFSADFNNGTPDAQRPGYYVLASWGELAMAGILATITCLQAGTLFAILLNHQLPTVPARAEVAGRTASGLAAATAAAVATTSLYAVTAAVYFGYPITVLLRWALLPSLPISLCATALAFLASRHHDPAAGWDRFLTFPFSSLATAAAGTLAITLWWQGGLPWWANGWAGAISNAGGILVGVSAACALTRHLGARIGVATVLGLFLLIISRAGPAIPAFIYALAAATWWVSRTGTLARTARAHVTVNEPT